MNSARSFLLVGAMLAPVAAAGVGLPAASAAPSASSAVPTARTAAAPRTYAAVAYANGREYLRLIDTKSGRVRSTLASVKHPAGGYFLDIDLAPDGSVYAVTADGSLPTAYRTRLRRYTTKGATALQPYIRTVKVAPDGRSLATTALSPDGDGDGDGFALEALRISDLKGVKVRDLMTSKIGVWKKGAQNGGTPGTPAVEAGHGRVLGWLPGGNIAVDWGCCDGGRSWIASSTRKNQSTSIPPVRGLSGTFGTTIIGYRSASVLQVQMSDDHVPWLRWGTARNYEGKLVRSLRDGEWAHLDAVARRYGATPLRITPSTYPYKGNGKVNQASL